MPQYKTLFIDDRRQKHGTFVNMVAKVLERDGFELNPIDFALEVEPGIALDWPDAAALLQKARDENKPYDIVISDLNFNGDGEGHGDERDGAFALKLAHQCCPNAALVLITNVGDPGVDTMMDIIHDAGLPREHWIQFSGNQVQGFNQLYKLCRRICRDIDRDRQATRNAEDVYEVVLFQNKEWEDAEGKGHQEIRFRVRKRMGESADGGNSLEFTLKDDKASIFLSIALGEGIAVSRSEIVKKLNETRIKQNRGELDADGGHERTLLRQIREELKQGDEVFGQDFSGEKGLIHTTRRTGYALSGVFTDKTPPLAKRTAEGR